MKVVLTKTMNNLNSVETICNQVKPPRNQLELLESTLDEVTETT